MSGKRPPLGDGCLVRDSSGMVVGARGSAGVRRITSTWFLNRFGEVRDFLRFGIASIRLAVRTFSSFEGCILTTGVCIIQPERSVGWIGEMGAALGVAGHVMERNLRKNTAFEDAANCCTSSDRGVFASYVA